MHPIPGTAGRSQNQRRVLRPGPNLSSVRPAEQQKQSQYRRFHILTIRKTRHLRIKNQKPPARQRRFITTAARAEKQVPQRSRPAVHSGILSVLGQITARQTIAVLVQDPAVIIRKPVHTIGTAGRS